MSVEPTSHTPPMPSSGRLILTLAIIAMLSGFTVVLVYQVTLDPIARNNREALEKAIFEVLPGATARVNYRLDDGGLRPVSDRDLDEANMFAGYDKEGRLVGVAFEAAARGYADIIRVLYGYSPERECVIGYTVLQSAETPGLGDKIETDPNFLANFDGLDMRLNVEQTGLKHDIEAVKPGAKAEPWQIEGIAGATVSSVAVARALRENANRMLPLLIRHLDELKKNPSPTSFRRMEGEAPAEPDAYTDCLTPCSRLGRTLALHSLETVVGIVEGEASAEPDEAKGEIV